MTSRWTNPKTWGQSPPRRELLTPETLNLHLRDNMLNLRESSLMPLYREVLDAPAALFDIDTSSLGEPVSYRHLYLFARLRTTEAAELSGAILDFNGDTTTANYRRQRLFVAGASAAGQVADDRQIAIVPGQHPANTSRFGVIEAWIFAYRNGTYHIAHWTEMWSGTVGQSIAPLARYWVGGNTVDSIQVRPTAGNFVADSYVELRGIR